MGEKETPTHSGRCIFYTLGIKMEPTRPTDSLVNHFYTTRVEKPSPTHGGRSFLKLQQRFNESALCINVVKIISVDHEICMLG